MTRTAQDVWAEISERCRRLMATETPLSTLSQEVENQITAVSEAEIRRRSRTARVWGEDSPVPYRDIERIWDDLVHSGSAFDSHPLRFAYALVGRLIDGVGFDPTPFRLFVTDETKADVSWASRQLAPDELEAPRERLFEALTDLRVFTAGETRAPHKPLLLLLVLSRYAKGTAPTWFRFAEIEPGLRDLIARFSTLSPQVEPQEPFWRLKTSGIWDLRSDGDLDTSVSSPPGLGLLRDEGVEGGFDPSIDAALWSDHTLASRAISEILNEYFEAATRQQILAALGLALEDGDSAPDEEGHTAQVGTTEDMHVLLRWQPSRNPDTVRDHKAIADRWGSVWWGKIGDPYSGRSAIAAVNMSKLRAQIAAGRPTHVYLHRPGELWRCDLLQLETEETSVDRALIPDYYSPTTQHHLWFRLANFAELPVEVATRDLVGASTGEPLSFAGQSALFLVREIAAAAAPNGGADSDDEQKQNPAQASAPADPWVDFTAAALEEAGTQAGLRIEPSVYLALAGALLSGKHVILTGPPGTAKTTLAEVTATLARSAGLCLGYKLTTATADWTTYETIGGLTPSPTDQGSLVFRSGHFLESAEQKKWLIVDELNRSNFDRAFGQLFTVLSGQSVVLPYQHADSGLPLALVMGDDSAYAEGEYSLIRIPRDWRIVATMNVFDKSLLFEMSFALMRRFAFIEVPAPKDDVYRALWTPILSGLAEELTQDADATLSGLLALRQIKEIGPAVFLDMARFASVAAGPGMRGGALAYQLFYSYLLPQFEGIDSQAGRKLYRIVSSLVGAALRPRLQANLHDVLGISVAATELAAEDEGLPPDAEVPDE